MFKVIFAIFGFLLFIEKALAAATISDMHLVYDPANATSVYATPLNGSIRTLENACRNPFAAAYKVGGISGQPQRYREIEIGKEPTDEIILRNLRGGGGK
ncbi:hypothetical protein [Psychromonas ossibalaenae]|uniref:hypothetical protein n=1 Tax=Psychromonas ossibalaenae TaxID=444922 RepID=UPI00036DDA3B|nr:hypothetical protein [Psychromonas ossibalaenae]